MGGWVLLPHASWAHSLTQEGIKDRDDHGPKFRALMHAINSSSVPDQERPLGGYHVTVYHTLTDEVPCPAWPLALPANWALYWAV